MKAIIHKKYGSTKNLVLTEIDKPRPLKGQVLVKIMSTAINDYDWSIIEGKPYLYRLMYGLFKPKIQVAGMEFSGVVEEIGEDVKLFKIGDSVYGDISEYGFGTFAEYICINENALIHKPNAMSFDEAASFSHAFNLALQGLRDKGNIQKGQKILINGGGGGVGIIGLQIAKFYDAVVTGVDSRRKLGTMKDFGFDEVVDYTKEDFISSGKKYDLILDTKTNRNVFQYLKSLNKAGKYVTVGGRISKILQLVLLKLPISLLTNKSVHLVALKSNKDSKYLNNLVEEGKLKTVIHCFDGLNKIPEALQFFGEARHIGKVIVTVSKDPH